MADFSHCPVCGSANLKPALAGLYDDRYGYPGHFRLCECAECGHRFLAADFSPAELQALYTEYYPRAARSVEQWRPHPELGAVRTWLTRARSATYRWVPRAVRVLDVGCGFGESLGYHRARGCEVRGVETDGNISRVAERFGFDVKIGFFRAADFPPAYFDFVTLDQVMEHVADPVAVLRDAAAVLRPGGAVLLSTPNGRSLTARLLGRRWVHWHAPYHLQFYSRRSLQRAAEAAGLQLVWCRNITNPRWYLFQWLHLLSRPAEGTASRFWTDDPAWPPGARVGRKIATLLHRLGVNHLVAFSLDGLAQGDNFVARLERRHE